MIVVDTNILVYLLIDGERTASVRKLRQQDGRWRFPTLWRHEFLNVLAVYVQNNGMSLPRALAVWAKAARVFAPGEAAVDMSLALRLAVAQNISAYDAQFLALAQSLKVPLVTEDQSLRKKAPGLAVAVSDFLVQNEESADQ